MKKSHWFAAIVTGTAGAILAGLAVATPITAMTPSNYPTASTVAYTTPVAPATDTHLLFTAFELRVVHITYPLHINAMLFRTRIYIPNLEPRAWSMTGRYFVWDRLSGHWIEYGHAYRWTKLNLPAVGHSKVLNMQFRTCVDHHAYYVRLTQTMISADGKFLHRRWFFPWAGFENNHWKGNINKPPTHNEAYRPVCAERSIVRT